MLTNREFAATTHIDAPLEGDMADFAMFSLDLGDSKATVGRDSNGKRIVKRIAPQLRGKGVNLWDLTPIREGLTLAEMKIAVAKQNELDHATQMAGHIARGYAFDERALTDPSGGVDEEDDEDPQDEGGEWAKFFSDDIPMQGGRCGTRKGGARDNSHFENFVDSAQ